MINDNIFREYDIRGIYNKDLTDEEAYIIGRGFGSYIKKMNEDITIVGHDNRISSPSLSANLIKGINDSGVHVIDLGLVTTPMYYYSKIFYKINTGIMVTASHNPAIYNGFKISFKREQNAYGDKIIEFRDFVKKQEFLSGRGNVLKKEIKEDYINLLINSVKINKRMKIVVDCGNGTGSIIIKDVLDRLNVEYKLINCESDGNFPVHDPDPSVNKNMSELVDIVKLLKYDLGIGIDGDADRVGLVSSSGEIIKTDYYLIIMYRNLLKTINNRRALFDVKCSRSLIDELDKLNIEKTMYRTGNSYINMKMQEGNYLFGGEYSGHIYFRDRFPGFDDGIYAGLRMLELLSNNNSTIDKELEGINRYFSTEEIKVNSDDVKKFEIVEKVKEYAKAENAQVITVCAKIESELSELNDEDKLEFLKDLGIEESGLNKLIKATYDLLGLATYFTAGSDEVRAWTFKKGMKAPQCAGIIHTDFEKGFIKAEVMSYDDLKLYGNDKAVKEAAAFEAQDKKRKEEVDVRNEADQMVYQIEKSMTDFGDKVTEDDKAKVQPQLDALKEALKGTDIEAIKTAKDELQKEFYEVAGKIYQAQGAAAGAAEGAAPQQDNGPVDGEVIDE